MLSQINYFKSLLLIFSICVVFQSCETEDAELNKKEAEVAIQENEQLKLEKNNLLLIKEYKASLNNKSENSYLTPQEFSTHFYSYQLLDDNNNIITLGEEMEANNVSAEDFFQMYQEKKMAIENLTFKATDAEIRSAMMDECEEYYLLEYACKAAVEIAYVLR